MAGKVNALLVSITSAPTDSAVIQPVPNEDKSGILYVDTLGTVTTLTLDLYGRAEAACPWFKIATITQADLVTSGTGKTAAKEVTLFPEMKARVETLTGAGAQVRRLFLLE